MVRPRPHNLATAARDPVGHYIRKKSGFYVKPAKARFFAE